MVAVTLKHMHKVRSKGKLYYYAWRGGPRVTGEPGTPEFMAAYNEAIANHRIPDRKRFSSVVIRYRGSRDYQGLADSTKRNWAPWLDRIQSYFGDLQTVQFDRVEKIKPSIRRWRGQYADKPRTADYGMQVLSRVLAYAVDPLGEIGSNPAEGMKHLYSNSRADIIWTEVDIAKVKAASSAEVGFAVDLASHTGLRAGDLVKLSWSHVGENAIVMKTSKSRGRREVIVPLYDELRDLLDRIPRRSTAILTSSLGRPWHKDGLSSRFAEAKHKAWPEGDDLNFHDLRGTAATRFYLAGLSEREIAELMGWEEEAVSKIIRRYVSRTAAIEDRIRRLNDARKRPENG